MNNDIRYGALFNGGVKIRKTGRQENDWYPTPSDVTESLLDWLENHCSRHDMSCIWEPACGDGSMSRVIEQRGYEAISSDISDYGYGKSGIDFLATRLDENGNIMSRTVRFS